MQSIEQRVDSLERTARRWKWTAGALAMGLAGVMVVAAGPVVKPAAPAVQELVRAKRIEIVNDDGKTVGELYTEPLGAARMTLSNAPDHPYFVAVPDGVEGGYIELRATPLSAGNNSDRVSITAYPKIGGSIELRAGDATRGSIGLQITDKNAGAITTTGEGGKQLWKSPGE